MPPLAIADSAAVPVHELRGHRVVLDEDLARAYGVPLRRLRARAGYFPGDFCFPLEPAELFHLGRAEALAFTERGVIAAAMALGVADAPIVSARVARLVATPPASGAAPR